MRGVDDSMKRKLFLGSVTDYKYLIQSECCDIAGVDDKEEFKDVMAALKVLQFEDTLVEEMFMLLASILILGTSQHRSANPSPSPTIECLCLCVSRKC